MEVLPVSLSIPKPRKEDRKSSQIQTAGMAFPKAHFERDAAYRKWIITHRCLLFWFTKCEGPVEAAHMAMGGRGIKGSDYSCLSLCRSHHLLLDGNSLDYEVMSYLWREAWSFAKNYLLRGAA